MKVGQRKKNLTHAKIWTYAKKISIAIYFILVDLKFNFVEYK